MYIFDYTLGQDGVDESEAGCMCDDGRRVVCLFWKDTLERCNFV